MGLVDYGSSSDSENEEPPPKKTHSTNSSNAPKSAPDMGFFTSAPVPSTTELPDASALFSSGSSLPSAEALFSRSGAGIRGEQFKPTAIVNSKKRPSVSGATRPQQAQPPKQPRANLLTSVSTSSVSAAMLPPQLRGRSNSATVDLEGMGVQARRARRGAS
eukprot:CAMPEP_0198213884 /NCGR_PEP_ID=MMETSP1445-20131203/35111_1 /TAXON_ID=36898 /ORGANISM="Pyramimonas sp., Strain CCMP2087" /LENGTH=160 /DNA_ID=CAMNT_0043888737 /DNA_START=220 /DNA_END=702 /DNA_ORIENTATION=-